MADDPILVEFRNTSWLVPGERDETLDFLRELGLSYVTVDAPQVGSGTAQLVPAVTNARLAYLRMHGRNKETWWGRGGGDRYDYNYTPGELTEWVRKIRELAERSKQVYVFFNNCHAGQAARNALLMRDMLQHDLGPGVR